jgi:abhydrolase domain-containing protein 13
MIYNFQDYIVYHPEEPVESNCYVDQPKSYNIPFETVEIKTSDSVKLHSYLLKQPPAIFSLVPTIVCFHGNAGNIGQRLQMAHYMYSFCKCNLLVVDYRGYGLSEGAPSEKGFYKDGEATINYILSRNDINTQRIIVLGQSIGGAVTIDLALKFNDRLFAFIVENTFTSLPDIARVLFRIIPGIQLVPNFFFKNQVVFLRINLFSFF